MADAAGSASDTSRRLRLAQGGRIRQIRRSRNLTLRQLAERISQWPGTTVTAAAVSEWERGVSTPRQHLQVALARELGVRWSELFNLDGEVEASSRERWSS